MFHDLDSTLAELLKRELPPALVEQVSFTFATPDGQFPPSSVALPTINLFLYEIQENRELRSHDAWVDRQPDGRASRVTAPVRVDCHYLVTAWAKSEQPERDEHRLLGDVMRVLLRHRELPAEVLRGSMKEQAFPLRAAVMATSQQQSRGDFWQALGGRPRAAFNYTVTVSIDVHEPEDLGPVVIEARTGAGRS
ncbi:Hypothetical protein A7982_11697 [Minicystis rosea]|nr:Hypothetical protein A7982_11697 [Minicystis rosea]